MNRLIAAAVAGVLASGPAQAQQIWCTTVFEDGCNSDIAEPTTVWSGRLRSNVLSMRLCRIRTRCSPSTCGRAAKGRSKRSITLQCPWVPRQSNASDFEDSHKQLRTLGVEQ